MGIVCNSKGRTATKQSLPDDGRSNTCGGKETCGRAETVPSTVQYRPICCPLGHLIGCPSRNISRRDRKPAREQKHTERRLAQSGLGQEDNSARIGEEEDAYLLHLKDLHSTHSRRRETKMKKKRKVENKGRF